MELLISDIVQARVLIMPKHIVVVEETFETRQPYSLISAKSF